MYPTHTHTHTTPPTSPIPPPSPLEPLTRAGATPSAGAPAPPFASYFQVMTGENRAIDRAGVGAGGVSDMCALCVCVCGVCVCVCVCVCVAGGEGARGVAGRRGMSGARGRGRRMVFRTLAGAFRVCGPMTHSPDAPSPSGLTAACRPVFPYRGEAWRRTRRVLEGSIIHPARCEVEAGKESLDPSLSCFL